MFEREEILPPTLEYFELLRRLDEKLYANNDFDDSLTPSEAFQTKIHTLLDMREHLSLKSKAVEHFSKAGSVSGAAKTNANQTFLLGEMWTALKSAWEKTEHLKPWNDIINNIEGKFGSGVGSFFRFLRILLALNLLSALLILGFTLVPQLIEWPDNYNENEGFRFEEIITGNGSMLNTPLFYGFYSSKEVYNAGYLMAEAYFYTILAIFVLTLLLQSIRMARLFSRNFIQAQNTDPNEFCSKIFAGWDFAIRGKHKAHNQKAIETQLKILLDQRDQDFKDKMDKTTSALEIVVHILVFLWTIGALIGIGYGTYQMLSRWQRNDFWTLMFPSVYVMLLMQVVPRFFSIVAKVNIRGSNGNAIRYRIYQTLVQTVALGLTLIVVTATAYRHPNVVDCWENQFGQEMWRWLFVYFFGIVLFTFLGESAYRFLQPSLNFQSVIQFDPPEFDIAQNTMFLIFGQTVAWVGVYHCPVLPFLFSLVLLVYFYIKVLSLKYNCNISTKPWRAGQSQTIFYMLTFASLITASVVFFLDLRERPSNSCGPFRTSPDLEEKYPELEYPYEILIQGGLRYVLYPGVAGIFVTSLIVISYYLNSQWLARRKQVKGLKQRLQELRRDNEILRTAAVKIRSAYRLALTRRNSMF